MHTNHEKIPYCPPEIEIMGNLSTLIKGNSTQGNEDCVFSAGTGISRFSPPECED